MWCILSFITVNSKEKTYPGQSRPHELLLVVPTNAVDKLLCIKKEKKLTEFEPHFHK